MSARANVTLERGDGVRLDLEPLYPGHRRSPIGWSFYITEEEAEALRDDLVAALGPAALTTPKPRRRLFGRRASSGSGS